MSNLSSDSSGPVRGHPSALRPAADPVARRWGALHEAAGIVAALAGAADAAPAADIAAFPAALRSLRGWRRTMVEQGIEDIAQIMETGIAALLSARESGAPCAAPARALWDEFLAARAGLIALVPSELLQRRALG